MRFLSLLLSLLIPAYSYAACNTPSPTPTPTGVPTGTPTPTGSPTPTPSPSPTPTLMPSASFTEDTTTSFANPFRGVQLTGQGAGKTYTKIDAYSGSSPSGTPIPLAGVPTGEVVYRNYWENIMTAASTMNSTTMVDITDYMARVRAANQSFNFRFIDFEPESSIDCPTWEANANGYTSTTNGILSGQKVCNWANSNTRSDWNSMLSAFSAYSNSSKFQSALLYHPTLSFLDTIGFGAFGENQYEAWTITSGTAGSVINGGQEIPPTPYSGIQYNPSTANQQLLLGQYQTNFPNMPLANTMGSPYSGGMSYALSSLALGWRADCWGFRQLNSPSSCVGGGYTQCFLYPTELGYTVNTIDGSSALHYSQNNGPVSLEVCNTLTTWNSTPYDIAQSLTWAGQVGASSVNIKNNFTAFSGFTGQAAFERSLGYRLYPATISHSGAVTAGNNLAITTTWYNRGYSKIFPGIGGYHIAFLFKKHGSTERYTYVSSDLPDTILPTSNPKTFVTSVPIPTYVVAGTWDVYVGIVFSDSHRPQDVRRAQIELAVDPQPADGSFWYAAGDQFVVTNASPTAVPVTDYAASFDGSTQFLLWTDSASTALDPVGTDITVAARFYLTSKSGGLDRPILSKGAPASLTQGYDLEWQNSTDKMRFSVSDGATIYTVTDTTLGSPTLNTWYCLIASYNKTTHEMRIHSNDGAVVTASGPTALPDTLNNFRVGGDAASQRWAGRLDKVRMWKRLLTSAEETQVCNSTGGSVLSEDMTRSLLEGNYVNLELDEASGNRMDSFQHYQYTDNGGVGQASAS